jgi:membrane associated rhomboid family serine protease
MVIPVSDDNPTHRTPWVNWALLAINLFVFVVLQPWQANPCVQQAFFVDWAAVPEEVVSGEPMSQTEVDATTQGACPIQADAGKNVYLSVITAMFLHGGWVHLLGNLLYLWIFGNNVEDRLGHLEYLIFYLGTGIIATMAFALANADSLSTLVGASGAIAGVLGAYLVLYPTARVTLIVPPLFFLPFRLPAMLVLGFWFVLQLFDNRAADMAGGGVAYLAHIAGFIAGAIVVLVLGYRRRTPPRPGPAYGYGGPGGYGPPRQPPRGWR